MTALIDAFDERENCVCKTLTSKSSRISYQSHSDASINKTSNFVSFFVSSSWLVRTTRLVYRLRLQWGKCHPWRGLICEGAKPSRLIRSRMVVGLNRTTQSTGTVTMMSIISPDYHHYAALILPRCILLYFQIKGLARHVILYISWLRTQIENMIFYPTSLTLLLKTLATIQLSL